MEETGADDTRYWREAIALFERLRGLPEAEAEVLVAAAPTPVRERLDRMRAADAASGPLDQPLPEPRPPAQLGRWRLGEVIGSGGMSTVYRARSCLPPEDQLAAVKLLALVAPGGGGLARFEREIGILARLRHPGIAPLFDAGVAPDGRPWFAMGLVEGQAIDAWCEARGADRRQRVALVMQVADAVAHAHRHLVVHRDIKPGNVMVDGEGRVVLLDFGISRVLEEGAAELTQGGSYPLTPRYAAPEQHDGGAVSTATDVWGLGALLHALLFYAPPRLPDGAEAAELPADATLPGDLGAILRQALAREPERRYASAGDFAADLQAWLAGRPVQARRGGAGYRLRRWITRHPAAAGLSLALLASVLAGTGASLWQAREARTQAALAEAARAQSEQALAQVRRERERAEALNRFVLGLFKARRPDRPLDELPSTAELLEAGITRARDPASGGPALRAQMLSAIAGVLQVRGRPGEARELVAEAVALAREEQGEAPAILVAALRQQADLAMSTADFALADVALADAERLQTSLETGVRPSAMLLALRRSLAMARASRQDYAGALPLFEAIHAEVRDREDLPPELLARAVSDLAVIYSSIGRYAEALPHSDAAVVRAQASGKRDVAYATAHSNNGRLRMLLGDFEGASDRLNQALATYDTLFDTPSHYRAAARYNLARVQARRGEFDVALATMAAASEEWARADGVDPATYAFAPLNAIEPLVLAGRWPEVAAAVALGRDRLLATAGAEAFVDTLLEAEAYGAIARCRLGDAAGGRALAGLARQRLSQGDWPDRARHALVAEAEAECHLAAGDHAAAAAALEAARADAGAIPPGDAAHLARRDALAARLAGAVSEG